MQALYPRRIRSYACREKRLTPFQTRLWEREWPQYGLSSGPFDFDQIFERQAARILEIGFGDGHSLLEMAKASPEKDFIGIEVYSHGVASLLAGAAKAKLNNLRIVFKDAVEILTQSIPDGSLDCIQIFFADPWPKTRHHKRRLIQPAFVSLLSRKLKQGGILHLATDWEDYARHMMLVINQNNKFKNLAGDNAFIPRPSNRPLTKYERRAVEAGRGIVDLQFQHLV